MQGVLECAPEAQQRCGMDGSMPVMAVGCDRSCNGRQERYRPLHALCTNDSPELCRNLLRLRQLLLSFAHIPSMQGVDGLRPWRGHGSPLRRGKDERVPAHASSSPYLLCQFLRVPAEQRGVGV